MKTGTRRFILRLIVGLLTFLIGVAAAMLLGGFRPFESFASSPNYRYERHYHHWNPEPTIIYPIYEDHAGSCRMRGRLGELAPPPPPEPLADAPMPPMPPRGVR